MAQHYTQVLLARHFKESPDDHHLHLVPHIYRWGITSDTTGEPQRGKIAKVQTKSGVQEVIVLKVKEQSPRRRPYVYQPVISFESYGPSDPFLLNEWKQWLSSKKTEPESNTFKLVNTSHE